MGKLSALKKPLVFLSDGYSLTKKDGRLCVRLKEKEHTFPVTHLSSLFLIGKGSMTTEALGMLSKAGVGLCLLSKNFKLKGIFSPEESLSSVVERRVGQYRLWEGQRLKVASKIVHMKIVEIEKEFSLDLREIKSLVKKASSLEELMGYEGIASRYMFESLSKEIPQFSRRTYRPPEDSTNALLSFSYSVAYYQAKNLLLTLGFDPYLSFLHIRRGKHASFASDILEPLRPFLTKHAVTILNQELIRKNHFRRDRDAFSLNKEGISSFLNTFESIFQDCLDKLWNTILELMEEDHEACGL